MIQATPLHLRFLALLALLIVVSACKPEEAVEVQAPPRPIKIYRLAGQGGEPRPDYPGRVQSTRTVELSFEVGGSIVDWNVEEGQRVKKGQVLSRLNPTDYVAQLDAAYARLQLSKAEYERQSKLFASGSATQRDLDVAIRRRDVDRAEVRIRQKAVDDTKLRALFDGVIARKLVTDYRNVSAREPVLLLQDDSVLEVVVDVPERALARRRREIDLAEWNARAKPVVELSALPGESFPAKLKELATSADPKTRTYQATFSMERPQNLGILPGMTAKVVLTGLEATPEDDFLLPAQAVVEDVGTNPYVWVVDEQAMFVTKREVEVGELTGDRIVVTSGVHPGDAIAMTGVHLLTEGMEVREMEISDETRR